jgi:hypothetical protein
MRILRVFLSAEQKPRKIILTIRIKEYEGREGLDRWELQFKSSNCFRFKINPETQYSPNFGWG